MYISSTSESNPLRYGRADFGYARWASAPNCLCAMGHSAEFDCALWAPAQNFIKRHELWRRIIEQSAESYELELKACSIL